MRGRGCVPPVRCKAKRLDYIPSLLLSSPAGLFIGLSPSWYSKYNAICVGKQGELSAQWKERFGVAYFDRVAENCDKDVMPDCMHNRAGD